MKLPTRLAVSLTTAVTGLMALSAEVHISHAAHVAALIVGGLVLGLVVHPGETGTITTSGPPYQVGQPAATPPAAAAVADPAARSLP